MKREPEELWVKVAVRVEKLATKWASECVTLKDFIRLVAMVKVYSTMPTHLAGRVRNREAGSLADTHLFNRNQHPESESQKKLEAQDSGRAIID